VFRKVISAPVPDPSALKNAKLAGIFGSKLAANREVQFEQPLDPGAQLERRLFAIRSDYTGNCLFD
jgi:hypothetical protein